MENHVAKSILGSSVRVEDLLVKERSAVLRLAFLECSHSRAEPSRMLINTVKQSALLQGGTIHHRVSSFLVAMRY